MKRKEETFRKQLLETKAMSKELREASVEELAKLDKQREERVRIQAQIVPIRNELQAVDNSDIPSLKKIVEQ